ncbi:MAG: sialidase family protein [Candidatus Cryptobacteroides sp.]
MKRFNIGLTILALFVSAVSCSKGGISPEEATPDVITVDAAGYNRAVYTEGTMVVPDKRAVLTGDLHPYFDGYELLVSSSNAHNGGRMYVNVKSPVYVLAPASPVPAGWSIIPNTTKDEAVCVCTYGTTSVELAVFTRIAYPGIPVEIPRLDGTVSAMPLAKRINYSDATPGSGDGLAYNEVQVKGELIDVRELKKGLTAYPQNNSYVITADVVEAVGKNLKFAVSHIEKDGVTSFRCGEGESPLVAFDVESVSGWKPLGVSFQLDELTFNLFTKENYTAGTWVDVKKPSGSVACPMVFGHSITVVGTAGFGDVEIARVPKLRAGTISNVCITVLPDGSYLTACTGSEDGDGLVMYRSSDKGQTWARYGEYDSSVNLISNYTNLFVLDGKVYLMGVGDERNGFRISCSQDNGMTWTVPADASTGLLLEGTYHTAQVPVVVADGRIWRACETYDEDDAGKKPFMMSAPVDSDLLNASNWMTTNVIDNPRYYLRNGLLITSLIEGNAVVDPDGNVVNLIRSNCSESSNYGTILKVGKEVDGENVTYTLDYITSPEYGRSVSSVEMPGGGKKFTVRYDEKSQLYWSLTNPHFEETVTNNGIYASGLSNSLKRNRLVLISSPDLKDWTIRGDVLYDPDPFFHGFQYADWVFDGEDLAVVVRAAYPEYRGLPNRQHDANKMIFVKVKNFRTM